MDGWHLEYSIDVDDENAVIYARVYGPWKAETAENYHNDFKQEATALLGKPWARLIDLSNWKTSRNEVTDLIGHHMAWSRDNNAAISLYVLDNPSTFRQLNQMITKGGTKEITRIFRKREEAEAFLKKNWLDLPKNKRGKVPLED